jgi:hypothetical protein
VTADVCKRERVENVLIKARLPASYRIIPRRHLETPLGVAPGDSRFCAKADGYTLLYATPDFATAFIEVIVRDRFTRQQQREVLLKEVTERAWAQISTQARATLSLLDLRNDGCVRLGAPTDAVRARNHAAGRALGRAIYTEHTDIGGFLFSSRLTGADVYAVFDRAIGTLQTGKIGDLADHPELPDVLDRHKISLLVPNGW